MESIIKQLKNLQQEINADRKAIICINDDGSGDVSEYTHHSLYNRISELEDVINEIRKV